MPRRKDSEYQEQMEKERQLEAERLQIVEAERKRSMRVMKNFGISPLLVQPMAHPGQYAGMLPFHQIHLSDSQYAAGMMQNQYPVLAQQSIQTARSTPSQLASRISSVTCLLGVERLNEILKLVKTFQLNYIDTAMLLPIVQDFNAFDDEKVKNSIEKINYSMYVLYSDWMQLFDWINNTAYFRNTYNDLPICAAKILEGVGLVDDEIFARLCTGMADLKRILTNSPDTQGNEPIMPWSTTEFSNMLGAVNHLVTLHGQLAQTFIQEKGHQ